MHFLLCFISHFPPRLIKIVSETHTIFPENLAWATGELMSLLCLLLSHASFQVIDRRLFSRFTRPFEIRAYMTPAGETKGRLYGKESLRCCTYRRREFYSRSEISSLRAAHIKQIVKYHATINTLPSMSAIIWSQWQLIERSDSSCLLNHFLYCTGLAMTLWCVKVPRTRTSNFTIFNSCVPVLIYLEFEVTDDTAKF